MTSTTLVQEKGTPCTAGSEKETQAATAVRAGNRRVVIPQYQIETADNQLVIRVLMPGVAQDGLDLQVEGRLLTIKGQVTAPAWPGFERVSTEFSFADYETAFKIPATIDTDGITAKLQNGELVLELPKAQELLPKKIAISVT